MNLDSSCIYVVATPDFSCFPGWTRYTDRHSVRKEWKGLTLNILGCNDRTCLLIHEECEFDLAMKAFKYMKDEVEKAGG